LHCCVIFSAVTLADAFRLPVIIDISIAAGCFRLLLIRFSAASHYADFIGHISWLAAIDSFLRF